MTQCCIPKLATQVVAVINMAGGWAGGCSGDADWVRIRIGCIFTFPTFDQILIKFGKNFKYKILGEMMPHCTAIAIEWKARNSKLIYLFEKVKNADLMWKQSVWSSAIAASIASRLMSIY